MESARVSLQTRTRKDGTEQLEKKNMLEERRLFRETFYVDP